MKACICKITKDCNVSSPFTFNSTTKDEESATSGGRPLPHNHHNDHISPFGYVTSNYFALVHRAIDRKEWKNLPGAQKAVDDEFKKLDARNFVDWESVMEKDEAEAEAKRKKQTWHFGSLMLLCREKC